MTLQKIVMTDPKEQDYFYEEAIKTLRTNIEFSGAEIKSIVVTSCYPNEGKSDILFQLAREMGKAGKKVLILDADIRKSSFVNRYQVSGKISGLSQYLSGQANLHDVVYTTNFTGVDIIFAGPVAPDPTELLSQQLFEDLLKNMRDMYDYILVDTPPILSVIDAAVAAKQCDGAVLVIESELVSRKAAVKAKDQLKLSGCRLLGAVLNKVDIKKNRYYSKYSYYYNSDGK